MALFFADLAPTERKTRYLFAISKLENKWDDAEIDEQFRILEILNAVNDGDMIIDIRPEGIVT